MPPSPQVIAKQTGNVKNSAPQGILRYININKRKISPQKAYSTEKNGKWNETHPLKNYRFELLDKINSAEKQKSTPLTASKPPPIFLQEVNSNAIVKIGTELIGNNNFHIVPLSLLWCKR